MQNAADAVQRSEARVRQPLLSDRLTGVLLMSIVPATFWTIVAGVAAPALGFNLGLDTALKVGCGLALFLAIVATAVTHRSE